MRIATGLNVSAVYAFARVVSRIAMYIALCIPSAGAYAESCNPTTPRLDPGTGFTPFGASAQALARAGHSGPAWEWALGANTNSGRKVQGSLDWVSGKVYKWKLVNTGTGREVLKIRDGGKVVLRLVYRSRMDAGNALELRVSTNSSIGQDTTIAASLAKLNGHPVSGSLSQAGTRKHSTQVLYYYFPQMTQGFTAEGTVSLTYRRKPPTGSRVQFAVRAGTIPCNSPGEPPTVSITSPVANNTFTASANITISANANDTDGTVTQVAFYANGNPIGAATLSPFEIQWANVIAGAYNLTAVATDKDGLQTTSSAVPITVNAAQALYFIHVDHLNTPRVISDANQNEIWRWDNNEPFGGDVPNREADSTDHMLDFPLRFPGQYADPETGTFDNWFRTYDSAVGLYRQSDPLGLAGGLNTYAYVNSNPLFARDVLGLWSTQAHNYFIREAYPGIPVAMLQGIMEGSANADALIFQTCANSYMHAMSCGDLMPPAKAKKEMERYIRAMMEEFWLEYCRGNLRDAGLWLGRALHPVMDSTSPAHRGFQNWTWASRRKHGDMSETVEDLKAAPPYRQETIDLMRQRFDPDSSTCDCSAK